MAFRKSKPETVMGHTLPEPQMTIAAWGVLLVRLLLPVLVIGSVLDLLAQIFFGICTGLWCFSGQ
ncbi:MAG: hypothetical protein WA888_00185 [Burkholderiaceae bacterium]